MDLSVLEYVKAYVRTHLKAEDTAVDMTAGNGYDTLFLASIARFVYAFDIQEEAIKRTKALLGANSQTNVTLIHDSHVKLKEYVKEAPSVVLFNFGYLPSADKAVTTLAASSVQAMHHALEVLKKGGACVMTLYPGHEEGKKEAHAIKEAARSLSSKHYTVTLYQVLNRKNAPFNIIIKKHA